MEKLLQWRNQRQDRLPMLLYGARQVGKTFAMHKLAAAEFKNAVYVNFEEDQRIGEYFQTEIRADAILSVLEKYYNTQIIADQTLIIFDEIQMCERALTSLKYFAEEAPEYHVIAGGSLLGVALKREQFSFPVGKVRMLTMYPMDFEEYLWAKGKVLTQEEIRQMILNAYIADMAKYAQEKETVKIFAAYDSLPVQLARDSKKFQYKLIKSGARASQYGDSIDWLVQAGIVNKCSKCTQGFMPPAAFQDLSAFKLYYSDLGLLSARTGMTELSLLAQDSERFRGIYAENYTACALRANGYELFYWESEGTAEVDFLIVREGRVIPVECKAGDHVKAKSLMVYREKYAPAYCIRISGRNFGMADGIQSVPLYAVFCI